SMIGGKPYKTYADLRGTTIGTQTLTSGTGFALRLVLKVHGMEYPRDYKLLNIGGAADRYQALTSGQISSAPVGVPLDLVAKEQGFNIIGYFADDQPNFQFNVYIVKRSWSEKNRALVVRFMKAMASTMRWMVDNREAACGYLSKEMVISVEHCRYASDYNWKNRIWDRNAELNVEGVRTLIKISAEQGVLKSLCHSLRSTSIIVISSKHWRRLEESKKEKLKSKKETNVDGSRGGGLLLIFHPHLVSVAKSNGAGQDEVGP